MTAAPPEDAWADVGYEPHEHGPAPAPDEGLPRCPWCGNTEGHVSTSSPPGIICGDPECGNHFTSAPGEYEAMADRRRLWAEETRGAAP